MSASRVDWRVPMRGARAEELTAEVDGWREAHDARENTHAILWHLGDQEYERVQRMEACYQCLTTFPARPSRDNMRYWVEAEGAGYNHIRPKAVAHRLIREERCPLCTAPISPEALGHNDKGENELNFEGETGRRAPLDVWTPQDVK